MDYRLEERSTLVKVAIDIVVTSQVDFYVMFTMAVFVTAIVSMIPELSAAEVSRDEAFICGLRGWLGQPSR